jgi:GT2 family glycosyltransferase
MSLPRISVVVPSLNQAPFLAEALGSVLAQDYPGLELIVMDGGSTDGSLEIIRAHERHLAFWRSGPDGGQSAAINRGVERSTGEIVCWLNSDDLFCEGALLHVGRAAAEHPGFGMYIGNGFRLDSATGRQIPYCRRPLAFSRRALREGGAYVHQPSTFFSRAAWKRVGGLEERLKYCMDWDVILRVAELFPVVLINEFLAVTREYDDTKTASGGMERAAEIRRMIEDNTGRQLSAGAAIFLIEAMLHPDAGPHLGLRFFRHLSLARNEAAQRLSEITGTPDCFPGSSDPGDVTYGAPIERPDAPLQQRTPRFPMTALRRLWAERPRGLLYRSATAAVVSAAALRLCSREAALARLRQWHSEGLFPPSRKGRRDDAAS